MSVLSELKWNYNHNLIRYYKGCEYLEKHRDEIDKWMSEIQDILNNMDTFLQEIMQQCNVTNEEILWGFETGNN